MQSMEIAQLMGLSLMDVECLTKGQATAAVANKLGVSMNDVEEFAAGRATIGMAKRLGFKNALAAQELAQAAGGPGILLGYMLSM
jgi:hypothetical protein